MGAPRTWELRPGLQARRPWQCFLGPVVLHGLHLGGEQQRPNRQLGGRVGGQPRLCLLQRCPARRRPHGGDSARVGEERRGTLCHTPPWSARARAEGAPQGQCDNSCGFEARRRQRQGAGARVAAPLRSSGAGMAPCSEL